MNRRDFFKGLLALGAGWQILPAAEFAGTLSKQFQAKTTKVACFSYELSPIETCTVEDGEGKIYGTFITREHEIRATIASELPIVPGEVLDLLCNTDVALKRVLVIAVKKNEHVGCTDIIGLYDAPKV